MVFLPVEDQPTGGSGSAGGEAGLFEGVLLLMACWCTVLASGLLSPVLPQIAAHFAAFPHVDLLVGFVATMPALSVALLAVPFGWLADQIGQRRVLLTGLLIYGVAGIIPFWLNDIYLIIAARAFVGVGEAGVMTASTALIGLRFHGERRGRWLAAQVAAANALGICVLFFGGLLGLLDWHMPFLAYGFALLLFLPSLLVLRQPAIMRDAKGETSSPGAGGLLSIVPHCLLILLATVAMFTIIIQMAFLMPERGAADSADIGLAIAFGATGVAAGALLSGAFAHISWPLRVIIGFTLLGISFLMMALVRDYWTTAIISSAAGLGAGIILPALLTSLVATVAPGVVGRAVGLWTAATFIAQFLNPPLFILLRATAGSQSAALALFGALCLVAAAGLAFIIGRRKMAVLGH